MKPIGPLMVEHRLIERMLSLMSKELDRIKPDVKVNLDFIVSAIDFIQMYTEKTHFGKEEDILFKELDKKNLNQEHARIMTELVAEHQQSRELTDDLLNARNRYSQDSNVPVTEIESLIRQLIDLHTMHIGKEDKHFFYPCLEYLSDTEQDDMLKAMWEFDRKLIHQKYTEMVEQLEEKN